MPVHTRRRALTLATAGAATASIAALLTAGHPAIAAGGGASAFGVSATGAAPLPPQPTASSPDGKPVSDSAPIASADGSITATATVNASAGKAKATITDLSLLFGQVTAGQVTATCQDGAGTVTITGGQAGDTPLPAAPTAGQTITITVGDTGSVQLNTQTTNPDGSTTVIGLRATITTPGGAAETITVASATCAHPTTPPPTTTTPAPTTTAPAPPPPTPPLSSPSQPTESATPPATQPTPGQPNRPAPVPTPVATHVAVTG